MMYRRLKLILVLFILLISASFTSSKVFGSEAYLDNNKIQFLLGGGWYIDNEEAYGDRTLGDPEKTLKTIFPGHIVVSNDVYIAGEIVGEMWWKGEPVLKFEPEIGHKAGRASVNNCIVSLGNAEIGNLFLGHIELDDYASAMAHLSAPKETSYALMQTYNDDLDTSITRLNAATNGIIGFRVDDVNKVLVTKIGVGIGLEEGAYPLVSLEVDGDVYTDDGSGDGTIDLGSNSYTISSDGNDLNLRSADYLYFYDREDYDVAARFFASLGVGALCNRIGLAAKSDRLFRNYQDIEEVHVQIDGSISLGLAGNNEGTQTTPPRIYFCGQPYENDDILWMGRIAETTLRTVIGDDTGPTDPEPYVFPHPGNRCVKTPANLCWRVTTYWAREYPSDDIPEDIPEKWRGFYCGGNLSAGCHPSRPYYDNSHDHNYWTRYWWDGYDRFAGYNIANWRYRHDSVAQLRLTADQALYDAYLGNHNTSTAAYNAWVSDSANKRSWEDALAIGWINSNGVWTAALHIKSDGGSIIQPSDFRLKKNLKIIPNALSGINKIRGIKFNWKDQDPKSRYKSWGVIAQEVEPVFPLLVQTDTSPESLKMVNLLKFVPVIIQALKEQEPKFIAVSAKLNKLKNILENSPSYEKK
ncbi:tail fiber domain-containing protein [Candidatus Margulisiibacteriota bacterium]